MSAQHAGIMLGDRLIIGNDVAELTRMSEWLAATARAVDIPPELVYSIDVCANEALTNIISYAYQDSLRHDIVVELCRTPQGARLVISDDGRPFDFLAAPAHSVPASLEEAEIGGLGIHMIRGMTTRCDYRRDGGLNVLTMELDRRPKSVNV